MRVSLSLSLLLLPAAALAAPAANFLNTAIARTVELGGSTTSVTTQYNVKSLVDGPGEYWLPLAGKEGEEPAWWEVNVGGKGVDGVKLVPRESSEGAPTVVVPLGKMKKDDTVTLSLTYTTIHAAKPLPATIEQRDPQYLLWKTESTYVDSWYPVDVERVKIRSPSPNILRHSSVPTTYTRDNTVTRASATITLGPFHSVPATLGGSSVEQQPFEVHYETKEPVMALRSLRRSAEVSHWGGNLNIQDELDLTNMGPKLKGHFSRLAHQQSRFHAAMPAQIFTDLTLRLPPTAHSVYYYDTIGNVSTSKFRAGSTPETAKSSKVRTSPRTVEGLLELKPRYPILGGWNYSFVVGWDMPLGDALKTDVAAVKNVLAVPFLTGVKDLVADDVELKIVLPEAARDVEVFTPFAVDSITHSMHRTYLDSIGRPAITIKKAHCTENHAQTIYVSYTYPVSSLLHKPLTVAGVVLGLFMLGLGLRRVDYSIERKK